MNVESQTDLSPSKQALLKIRELKKQLAESKHCANEPIAVVSMACRFPGGINTPEEFWESLDQQKDLVGEVPSDRWDLEAFFDDNPDIPGKMYARKGAFLDQIDLMDPEFFGISPREATWVDPQQRLLMEVGWEAIERARWLPEKIASRTGVFVGWMHNDYQNEASDSFLNLNPYIATGAAGSFLCGRLAYYLGLQGPTLAVDTACSSSLVALHVAIQSLQRGDCDQALVGGVNVICSPTTNILTCKLRALSPNGHSRAFDADADGYLRGEGCGVVTLKRLKDAQADNDPVLAVVRGSAIGHNGKSSGLTAPNPRAQEAVIREALNRASIDPAQIAYLEAHGTGTELGDPIEIRAAAAALATKRTDSDPLLVGSVKTNIGHLEAAAGMAGLIKVILAFQHDQIPGQLNFETPNPHIPWDQISVRVLTNTEDWPASKPKLAGVSAFGMSGTNAHAILDGNQSIHPSEVRAPSLGQSIFAPVTLSAKSDDAINELADRYLSALKREPSLTLQNLTRTTNLGRSHFEHRAAIFADHREALIESLLALKNGGVNDDCNRSFARSSPKLAWQFTGQGSQFLNMGKRLFETNQVFREAIEFCDQQLKVNRSISLIDVLFGNCEDKQLIDNTMWTQPAIFGVQMGLAKMLADWGIEPDVVMGHSVGQFAAACVAGIMDWKDGIQLIAKRGELIASLPQHGKMIAVFSSEPVVEEMAGTFDKLSIAAFNGSHVVLSGVSESIDELESLLSERGIRGKRLVTSHAFHSRLMEPILDEFADFANQIEFNEPSLPLVCNVSGRTLSAGTKLDGQYWAQHIRQPVRYRQSVEQLEEIGCECMIELGPSGTLSRMAASVWKQNANLMPCLNPKLDDVQSIRSVVGMLYSAGVQIDFGSMHKDSTVEQVDLPTYPFQRRRFWGPDKPKAAHAAKHTAHPLLGQELQLAGVDDKAHFQNFVDVDSPSWVTDHKVMEATVLPGAALLEMASAASPNGSLVDVQFERPLNITQRTELQTTYAKKQNESVNASDPTDLDAINEIEIFARTAEGKTWTRLFKCQQGTLPLENNRNIDRTVIESRVLETAPVEEFYEMLDQIGLNYGTGFRVIQDLRYSETEVLAKLSIESDIRGYRIPPPILDGALHCLAVGLLKDDSESLFLPVGLGRFDVFDDVNTTAWCHATWTTNQGENRTADLVVFDDDGKCLARINELKVKQISLGSFRQMTGAATNDFLYQTKWQPISTGLREASVRGTQQPQGRLLVVRPNPSEKYDKESILGHPFVEYLKSKEEPIYLCDLDSDASEMFKKSDEHFVLPASSQAAWQELLRQTNSTSVSDDENMSHIGPINGIVWLVDETKENDNSIDAVQQRVQPILLATQSLLAEGIRRLERGFAVVTTNSVQILDEMVNPTQASVWGFGKVLAAEQPALRVRLFDLYLDDNDNIDKNSISTLGDMIRRSTDDSQIVLRGSDVFSPKLHKLAKPKDVSDFRANANGCYLITGGLGKLGREAAKWLVDSGATEIILASRREPGQDELEFLESLRTVDCEVKSARVDVTCEESLQKLLDQILASHQPLVGVIHTAGVLDDGLVDGQSPERFEQVLLPKIQAADLLDRLTRSHPIELFVLYSSVASILGSPGQSNYSTANAFMDGLCWSRHQEGLPALSVNWGPWSVGMADDPVVMKRMATQGIRPLGTEAAHQCLSQLLQSQQTQATVLDADWRKLSSGFGGASSLLSELVLKTTSKRRSDSAFVTQLKKTRGDARRGLLLDSITKSLQRILGTPKPPETDRPLMEMGLDSLMAVEFGTELQQMLGDGFDIGPTMLFDHPTIDAICDHVLELVGSESSPVDGQAKTIPDRVKSASLEREDIAVIGMGCRFPGAENVDQFWHNLLEGVDSVCDIPSDRWDIDRFYDSNREDGKMYSKQGGFLSDIAQFDASFFGISQQEACWIDPQHRMLIENTYHALEDAGIPVESMPDRNVGVFMGLMGQDYAFLPSLDDQDVIRGFQGAGLSHSAGVGRISYLFGFEGPSVAVDTASSSSLVATIQAMRSLQDGHCNLALAGGVNAILAPVNSLLMSKAGLLSSDGRCKSFSDAADGFGRGEGCGIVVLKRLSDAQRDGDRIMAVIRGGSIVHNGFSSSITSPSGKAQSRAIDMAIRDAGIAPTDVQYLEAHGTGTEFGDPMELNAALTIYGKGRKKDNPLVVGSVKANISHLEAAGGASGLIKTVLSIFHGTIPKQIHFETPSKHIPWTRLAAQIPSENLQWPECARRTAGVTAIGLVGTNAHLILSEPESIEDSTPRDKDPAPIEHDFLRPLFLSAKSKTALHELMVSYGRFLESTDSSWDDICFSAATARKHYGQRITVFAKDNQDAVANISDLIAIQNVSDSDSIYGMSDQPSMVNRAGNSISISFQSSGRNMAAAINQLASRFPVVVSFVDDCHERVAEQFDLKQSLRQKEIVGARSLAIVEFVFFASVAKVIESWGIQPDSVSGAGVGQYASAGVAGCLCFLDALELIAEAGETRLAGDDWANFESFADRFNYYPPSLPLYCSLTQTVVPIHRSLGGSYWREFEERAKPQTSKLKNLPDAFNCEINIEVQHTVTSTVDTVQEERNMEDSFIGGQVQSGSSIVLDTMRLLQRLYEAGCAIEFDSLFNASTHRRVRLPLYPFDKKRYWITEVGQFVTESSPLSNGKLSPKETGV